MVCEDRRCKDGQRHVRNSTTFLLWTLPVVMVIVGLIGVVMPALPGHMLILGGFIVGAWANGFTRVGVWTLVVIGVIALASYGVDFVAVASARSVWEPARER